MAAYPKLNYQVQEAIFDSKSMLDENNFYNQRQGAPSELSRRITYILGDYTKNYPISLMTLGGMGFGAEGTRSRGGAVELDDLQFTYPVMGRDFKASICAGSPYSGGDKPGVGNSTFVMYFTDNWIKRFYIIESPRGIQAYVTKDAEPAGTMGWKYTCILDPAEPEDFCPLSELEYGTLWVDLNAQVSESESRTTESKMSMPGSFKNQMGVIRAGISWAGNAANKMMKISMRNDKGQESKVWMDYAMWQFEKRWVEECEHAYWYSRYNRNSAGIVSLKDQLTGKIIPRGSGILEQIGNRSTYSSLTYDSLANKVGDALFGQSDTANMNITLYTGRGGMREFDRAMKKEGIKFLTDFTGVADKFVTGTGRNLMLGGFFDGFYHIDGYTIKVKYNPIYDMGRIALKSPLHPESGLPLESYRMTFIDDNDYDGQPNIQHVHQKGRAFLHGIIPGMAPLPRSLKIMGGQTISDTDLAAAAPLIVTDKDESAYTRLATKGIQILRANKCFDLQCVAGL